MLPTFNPTDTSLVVGNALTVGLITAAFLTSFFPTETKKAGEPKEKETTQLRKYPAAILSASLFSVGLAMSGMTESANIFGFLDMKGIKRGTWNPTLLFVMGGGLLVSMLSYEFVPGYSLLMVSVKSKVHQENNCGPR
jgi:hypothetical protein